MHCRRWLGQSVFLLAVAADIGHAAQVPPEQGLAAFGPGIWVAPGRAVIFAGKLLYDQGPAEGLEVIAALRATKLHESLIELDTDNAVLVLTALIMAFGEGRGRPADSMMGSPPRGAPVWVTISWQSAAGTWATKPVAALIRDRQSDHALPVLPAVYSGGGQGTYQTADGSGRTRQGPVLVAAGNVIALFDEECGAPLALAVPNPAEDKRWEANSAVLPPPGTPLRIQVELLTAEALAAATTATAERQPGRDDIPPDRAYVVVRVPAERPRSEDQSWQRAFVSLAEAQGRLVVPVFIADR